MKLKKETIDEEIKKTSVRKNKPGPKKGCTNNPNGRPKGSKNKVHYDVKKAIAEKVCDPSYVQGIFDDIAAIEDADKRAKLKIELVKLFVPRPLNDDEQKDKDIKSAIWDKLSREEDNKEE